MVSNFILSIHINTVSICSSVSSPSRRFFLSHSIEEMWSSLAEIHTVKLVSNIYLNITSGEFFLFFGNIVKYLNDIRKSQVLNR